jgi:hypothetical protein
VKRGIELTLSKSKDGPLNVKSIDVYTKSPSKNITDLERFQCGGFDLGGSKLTKETKQCKTGDFGILNFHYFYPMLVQPTKERTRQPLPPKMDAIL